MVMLIDILATGLMAIGAFFVFVGGLGALRMPDFYTRMHAASLTDSAGPIFILSGLMVQSESYLVAVKLFAVLVFLLITAPTASNALASASLLAGNKPGLAVKRSSAE
ncbi:MAG TPA: monovalent cation/H(+) antiporter subunit G [Pseudomonadales bacterium]|nr:monovalent cation/H(+) antiporter subunit G [Pseudomonadales bacterium]